jgi:hypothetical protein
MAETTQNKTAGQIQKIGDSAVNHLYKLYLGRDANSEELAMYKNHPDDTTLRKDLEFARKSEMERRKTATEMGQVSPEATESTLDDDFFRGQYGLVQFTEDPDGPGPASTSTIWLVDPQSKKLIPFLSEAAFDNVMTKPLKEVVKEGGINKISLNQIGSFKLLTDAQGIKEGGTIPTFEVAVDETKIGARYGQEPNPQVRDVINKSFPGFIKLLKSDPNSGVSTETLDEALNNDSLVAFYVNALTYGDYQLPDIYRDLKRRELVKQGNEEFKSMKIIDESQMASQFYGTPTGQAIKTNPSLTLPRFLGDIDTGMLNYSVFNLPDEVYKVLVPPMDWTTPEGQKELDSIKSAYHDVLMKQLEAVTEQVKALADYEWNSFKDEVSKKYGIALSDNATQAWGQLENLSKGYAGRGLRGSGLFEEARDKYLQGVRRADERLREDKVSEENKTRAEHLRKIGTPEQIKEFLEGLTDEKEKEAFGRYFKPSEDIKKYFSKENLRTLYPDLSEQELTWYSESIIDPTTGFFRSQLQQQISQNRIQLEQEKRLYQMGDVQVDPTTGKVIGGYGAAYKKALEEERAYAEYTKAEPFEKPPVAPVTPSVAVEPSAVPPTPPSWQAPTGYERVPGPSKLPEYEKIVTEPETIHKWGIKKPTQPAWKAPTDYERISGPSRLPQYSNIVTEPGTIHKWGTLKTATTPTQPIIPKATPTQPVLGEYVSSPEYLRHYKESELSRQSGGKIYLKHGIKKRW